MSSHLLAQDIDLSVVPRDSYIIEIGSVRDPNSTNFSTVYLHERAEANGLGFHTVDISPKSSKLARRYVGSAAICQDGVSFLKEFNKPIALLYLDNFDYPNQDVHLASIKDRSPGLYTGLNLARMQKTSALVHLRQAQAANPRLAMPSWIIIDDTRVRSHRGARLLQHWGAGWLQPFWGKGQLAVPYLLSRGCAITKYGYNGILIECKSTKLDWGREVLYLCWRALLPLQH